ncbi:LysR family transcriptional regulator [Azospirillum sp. TSH100]|uniref:LysR family transcriptional regulator n=1 Tax=Azospirillum sp. TSH100 TaxID=652764 RepID=UPI000D611BE4|nr:LysR family transcriptional regulator [Azospirillum sp. TSH100]PWC82152.1 LysR family transcriptional regulator [Azospirillum sp. TSH100]QCG91768.1 LysR family transcriptional regulator [Azospirillum sp. TSH100]
MEWSDLRIFLAIARAGTLGAAARRIGQTQPTMGRRLRALEESVGHALFQRTSDGFVLTDEGTAVLRHAERMEEESLALERELSGQGGRLEGSLRLSSSDWFGLHMLTPVIRDFTRRHPGVMVELLTESRLLSLSRREADLVFRIRPFDEPDVVQRKLTRIDYALYGPIEGPEPKGGDGSGCALVTMDTAFGGMPDVAWLRRMLPNAHVAFRSNNRDVQAAMAAFGVGLAVLPRPIGDVSDRLRVIDLGEPPPGRDVWVGYHQDLRRLARLRFLLDLMIERFS